MLTSVFMTGRIGKKIDNIFRNIEIERTSIFTNETILDEIPICGWQKSSKSHIMNIKDGTLIVVKGRIERDDKHGLYVVCEILQFLGSTSLKTTV